MKMVVDTNIILSALIKDSTTRKIIVKSEWDFYYPAMSFHEIRKYKELVLKKSNLNKEEYRKLLNYLLEQVGVRWTMLSGFTKTVLDEVEKARIFLKNS